MISHVMKSTPTNGPIGSPRPVFHRGHPSKYKPWSTCRNVIERATELALVNAVDLVISIIMLNMENSHLVLVFTECSSMRCVRP